MVWLWCLNMFTMGLPWILLWFVFSMVRQWFTKKIRYLKWRYETHLFVHCISKAYVRENPARIQPYKVQYLHFGYLKLLVTSSVKVYYGLTMLLQWFRYGVTMVLQRCIYIYIFISFLTMVYNLLSLAFTMVHNAFSSVIKLWVLLWSYYGFTIVFHAFSTVWLWFKLDQLCLTMVLLWFHMVLSWFCYGFYHRNPEVCKVILPFP